MNPSKPCLRCKRDLPETADFFYRRGDDRERFINTCIPCRADQMRITNRAIKLAAMMHYGNGKPHCSCCGEPQMEFLVIDHIAGGGNRHRKQIGVGSGTSFYYHLAREGYPPGYRVLCQNCNASLAHFGYCPHELARSEAAAA